MTSLMFPGMSQSWKTMTLRTTRQEENEPEGDSEPEEETEPERETDLEEETKTEEPTEW